jgi:hypothetical protein
MILLTDVIPKLATWKLVKFSSLGLLYMFTKYINFIIYNKIFTQLATVP